MKNIALFLGIVGIAAFVNEFYLLAAFTLSIVTLMYYFGVSGATGDLSEFYNRLPTIYQDIPETLALAKEAQFFADKIDISSASGFYKLLENNNKDFDVKVDEILIDVFEGKYDVPVLESVSLRSRALSYYFVTIERHPEDIERLADIAQAIMVRKKLGGTPKRTREDFSLSPRPVFN